MPERWPEPVPRERVQHPRPPPLPCDRRQRRHRRPDPHVAGRAAARGQPGFPLHSFAAQLSTSMATIYPTIGLRSALTAGQYRVLRAAGSQGNQSVDCEPTGGQGHDFQMFMNGCDPYYGFNRFGPPDLACVVDAAGRRTPARPRRRSSTWPNDPSDRGAWKCVPAAPGFSSSVIADGIAARTGNCDNIQNNSCSRTACNFPSRYPATPDPTGPPTGRPEGRQPFRRSLRRIQGHQRAGWAADHQVSALLRHRLGRARVERRPLHGRRPGAAGGDRRVLHCVRRARRTSRRDALLRPRRPDPMPGGSRALRGVAVRPTQL